MHGRDDLTAWSISDGEARVQQQSLCLTALSVFDGEGNRDRNRLGERLGVILGIVALAGSAFRNFAAVRLAGVSDKSSAAGASKNDRTIVRSL